MTKSSPSHHSATTETTFRFSCKLGAMQVLQAAWPEVRSRELSPPQISPAPMHRLRPCMCRPRVGAHPPYRSRRLYHEVFPEHAAHPGASQAVPGLEDRRRKELSRRWTQSPAVSRQAALPLPNPRLSESAASSAYANASAQRSAAEPTVQPKGPERMGSGRVWRKHECQHARARAHARPYRVLFLDVLLRLEMGDRLQSRARLRRDIALHR